MAEELRDPHLLGLVLELKAFLHTWYWQPGEAVDAGLRSAELLRSAGDLWQLVDTQWTSQYALILLGRFDEAAKIGEEVELLAQRLGHLGALMAARRGSATVEFMRTGDIDGFEEFANADLELCRSADMPWISGSFIYLGRARFLRGRWQEALQSFHDGTRLEPPGILAGQAWAGLFLVKAYAGDRDAALAMLEQRRDKLPRRGQASTFGAWEMLFGVVEGLAVLGERHEAADLYPLVLQAIDTGTLTFWYRGPLHTYAGMAAAAGGQWEKAEEHYQTALRQAHELPVAIEQPEVRRWYARMLIDRNGPGDRDKARQLLTEAIATYRQIGMPNHVGMAEAMLGEV